MSLGSRSARTLDRVVLLVVVVAAWQAVHRYAGDAAITAPLDTVRRAAALVVTADFWGHAQATGTAFVAALAIAIVTGVALGLLFGVERFAGDVAEPILVSLYAIPKVTLYPVILLLFGLGLSAKVAFGVIHGVIPVILFTLGAIRNIDPVLVRTCRIMRLTRWQTAATVLAPAVLPELMSGVRVGFSLTMLGVLIGEMFASQRGLGFLITNGMSLNDVPLTTSVVAIVVAFAIAANGVLLAVDDRVRRR